MTPSAAAPRARKRGRWRAGPSGWKQTATIPSGWRWRGRAGAEPVAPTHWSFGQLCTLVGAPTSYLRQLPATLSDINLQHGLLSHRAELVKTLEADNGRVELRAVTGPDYGRI